LSVCHQQKIKSFIEPRLLGICLGSSYPVDGLIAGEEPLVVRVQPNHLYDLFNVRRASKIINRPLPLVKQKRS
jgi:hypothetical protein